ncbi:hypothetical protein DRI50_07325 [candidate division KSB1 bacterium]|nr:MAG: hypothetical protein DRI50_07325 [candidate division KSB1 bacterium]
MAAPKNKSGMNKEDEQKLTALLELLDKLSIQVKYARGYFRGGLVRYRDQLFLYLNRAAKMQNKIEMIVNELQYIEIPPDLMTPQLREIFEKVRESNNGAKLDVNKNSGSK